MSTNLNQTLEQYKEKIISQLQKRLKEERLFATGNLYTSFYGEVIGESELTIYSSAKYAEAVQKGINPGYRPPKSKIEDWARSKNITPEDGSFNKMVNSIRNSIYKFGTIKRYNYEGSKFIDYVANNIIASLTKDIEESYLKDINNAINGNS